MAPDPATALIPWAPDPATAPEPDPIAEPDGFVVRAEDDVQLHFLDWGGPDGGAGSGAGGPPVLLLPGLLQPAWSWAPVARRLRRARRTVVTDLRGQGLSDAPLDGFDLDTLALDVTVVAEGSGIAGDGTGGGTWPIVLAGHGFGAVIAARAAELLGDRCAGLVLVDGGWERLEVTTDLDVDEFLRGLDEPPEVMRSLDAYLADRRAFDPATWDADQERAARDAVVETAAGHVVRAVRPFVVEALVRTMFGWDPAGVLDTCPAPVSALVALDSGDADVRLAELRRSALARATAGRSPVRAGAFPAGHNLMRYEPAGVTAAILDATAE
jgi:pimeloyl-ACP methyl ester carboxylesterase